MVSETIRSDSGERERLEMDSSHSPTTLESSVGENLHKPEDTKYQPYRREAGAVDHGGVASAVRERNDGITLLAFYHFAWGGLYLVGALLTAIPTLITGIVGIVEDPEAFIATVILGFALFFIMGLSLLYFAVGFGLWRLNQWGRTAAMALGLISLPTGLGTIPGALTLWYLMKEDVAQLFR